MDHSTPELQRSATPQQILQWLKEGNERFRTGKSLRRDARGQLDMAGQGQFPLAVVMTCMDARTPTQMVFDMGVGDLLNISQAGNALLGPRNLASVEYGCAVAGARLVVILGHIGSAVVEAAVATASGCGQATDYGEHFDHIVDDISQSMDRELQQRFAGLDDRERRECLERVAYQHVLRSVRALPELSRTIRGLVDAGSIAIIGAMVNPANGSVQFLMESAIGQLDDVATDMREAASS